MKIIIKTEHNNLNKNLIFSCIELVLEKMDKINLVLGSNNTRDLKIILKSFSNDSPTIHITETEIILNINKDLQAFSPILLNEKESRLELIEGIRVKVDDKWITHSCVYNYKKERKEE